MKVLISGATGFIGRHLAQRLLRDGHEVTAWVRDRLRAEKTLGTEIQVIEGARGYQLPAEKLEAFDAVINLAGESIVGGRWTGAKKKRILESRVRTTQALVKAINECKNPPKVFFSASATGFYGHGDAQRPFDENCNAGNDFLAQVSEQWESAAKEVNTDTRLVIGRISLVLGLEEGLLGKLTPLFDAGLGGVLGSGKQIMPWIHIADLVEIISHSLTDPRFEGPINLATPNPVTHRTFCKDLANTLGRPCLFGVPGLGIQLALGEASEMILKGSLIVPKKLEDISFVFAHPTLPGALEHIFKKKAPINFSKPEPRGRERHVLTNQMVVNTSFEKVRPFFFFPKSLALLSPPSTKLDFLYGYEDAMRDGHEMAFRFKLGPFSQTWTAVIEENQPEYFVDTQTHGPMSYWHHKHSFKEVPEGTELTDEVRFRMPLGPLGQMAFKLFAKESIRRLFLYRNHMLEIRFGTPQEAPPS